MALLTIDATHAKANTMKLVPERIMKHLAKGILKNIKQESVEIPPEINATIPDYKGIEDHKEAKEMIKTFLENMMTEIENNVDISTMAATLKAIVQAKEVLSHEKFIIQKGLRSLVDKDARVGYKSKTDSFFSGFRR